MRTHGRPSTYSWGCRCGPCRTAFADYMRDWRRHGAANLALVARDPEGIYRCGRCAVPLLLAQPCPVHGHGVRYAIGRRQLAVAPVAP
jgi:hypothetical protein